MEEKESTFSGSLAKSDTTESPPPLNMNMVVEGSLVNAATPSIVSNSVDISGKKKRGRPRKYDADGNLRVPSNQRVETSGFSLSSSNQGLSNSSVKKTRGRARGFSSSFHFLASFGELFATTAGGDFTPHVVTVNTGEDVVGKILSFPHKGPRGICVLSANGSVSNVTIRQPGSSGGILTYEGRFEILSLTGSFTVSEAGGGIRARSGGLSVSLASPDGRVIGGGVAGLLLAASPIQLVVGSFVPDAYKAQIKKQQRENTMAFSTPVDPGLETAARTNSQAKFNIEASLTTSSRLPQHNTQADSNTHVKMVQNATVPNTACWNGIENSSNSNERISPDINISLPSEDDDEHGSLF